MGCAEWNLTSRPWSDTAHHTTSVSFLNICILYFPRFSSMAPPIPPINSLKTVLQKVYVWRHRRFVHIFYSLSMVSPHLLRRITLKYCKENQRNPVKCHDWDTLPSSKLLSFLLTHRHDHTYTHKVRHYY